MTVRKDILQAVRDWFALAIPAITLVPVLPTDPNQIIPGDKKGPRPGLPYLTVKVTSADVAVGVDEQRDGVSGGGAPTVTPVGQRSGSVSVQGYGDLTSDWLQDATLALGTQAVRAIIDAAGLTVTTLGSGVTDLSTFIDTAIEARFLKEFTISYAVMGATETLVELATVEMDLTLIDQPGDPDPLLVDIEISV